MNVPPVLIEVQWYVSQPGGGQAGHRPLRTGQQTPCLGLCIPALSTRLPRPYAGIIFPDFMCSSILPRSGWVTESA